MELLGRHELKVDRPGAVLQHYDAVKEIVGEQAVSRLLRHLAGRDIDWKRELPEKLIIPLSEGLLADIATMRKADAPRAVLQAVDAYLHGVSQDVWAKALEEKSDPLPLLLRRLEAGTFTLPPGSFRDVLKRHAIGVMEQKQDAAGLEQKWPLLVRALTASHQKKIAQELLREIGNANATSEGLRQFIRLYEPLASRLPFATDPDNAVSVILGRLVAQASSDTVAYIEKHAEGFKAAFRDASDEAKQILLDTLRGEEETGDEKRIERTRAIRRIIGADKA